MNNFGNQSPENIQILTLHEQGYDASIIASALKKDPQIVALIIKQQMDARRKLSLEERYGDLKTIAIQALKEVCQSGESEGARIGAAKILLEEVAGNHSSGGVDKFDYNMLAERLVTAQTRVEEALKDKENIVQIPPEYKANNVQNNVPQNPRARVGSEEYEVVND